MYQLTRSETHSKSHSTANRSAGGRQLASSASQSHSCLQPPFEALLGGINPVWARFSHRGPWIGGSIRRPSATV